MADIELIIKIPEEEYKWIKKSDETVFADVASKECMLHAIRNGTPLPKGHGRLIDADEIHFESREFDTYEDYSRAFDAIDYAETIVEADKEDKE